MGCWQSREKEKNIEVSDQAQEKEKVESDIKQSLQDQSVIIKDSYCQQPSISFFDDNHSDSILNGSDEKILEIKQLICKNKAKPQIQKKNIHRNYSPKRDQKQNESEFRLVSSQKLIEANKISKNKWYHEKYHLINRKRMNNKINSNTFEQQQQYLLNKYESNQQSLQNTQEQHQQNIQIIQEQQNQNLQNTNEQYQQITYEQQLENLQITYEQQKENLQIDLVTTKMSVEPFNEEDQVYQNGSECSENDLSRPQEIDYICYSCQTKISQNIYQIECLHHYHYNCLLELIIQQIDDKKLQIHCRCNQLIRTKLLAIILQQQNKMNNYDQNQDFMEIYFQNQYDFLTQNLY
ncbi:unnamed protein product [Paramecium pentaurelia]|uniref:RING-type domain-containing protein n=1 Tax=Paramecium pentaurelia TaxID=43138 RepID=A0A8S1U027_9CILI|nr:unnamed protein product [Paramecium pentaurelia]